MTGVASFHFMSFLPSLRQFETASTRLFKPYSSVTPLDFASLLTKLMEIGPGADPKAPNIGRIKTGCGVGMDALGSPICAHAIIPPLMTISGFAPNNAG